MKLTQLIVALALVSCGEQTSLHGQTGSGTGAPACVLGAPGEWLCAGLGVAPTCPIDPEASGPCVGSYPIDPAMPLYIHPGESCLVCANGQGTVWTCESGGWQLGATLSC
jgi:hypothetical protein